ncbi:hypothetical protein TYRP_018134 [Tyrophagus putrescentiae]|nr:hypothetical protein TYRP_018134 [Tyrophagus putrescentiae]
MVAIIRALPLLLVDGEAESLLVILYTGCVQVADGAVFGHWGRLLQSRQLSTSWPDQLMTV